MTWGEQRGPRLGRPVANVAAVAVGFVVIASFVVAVVAYFLLVLPPQVLVIGILLAFVPLVIVLVGVWLVDRWEPEPKLALLFAFFWGAGVSVGAALLFDFAVQTLQSAIGARSSDTADVIAAVVQAPIVEESAKGIGVLLVLWIFRRHFDGPIDGIVYAAMVAAGFAFVENIQYFSVQVVDQAYGGESVAGVFLVRALMAPFGHIIYTSCIGFALGLAARRTGPYGAIGYFFVGLIPAMLLHALWNGALVVVGDSFVLYYVLVQVPIFLACVALVILLRFFERRVTRRRLTEYAAAGWFDPAEVALLSSGPARRRALRWARHAGAGRVMRVFISDSTRLASTREKIVSSRRSPAARLAAQRDESELLASVSAAREWLQVPVRSPAVVGLPVVTSEWPPPVGQTAWQPAPGNTSWPPPVGDPL